MTGALIAVACIIGACIWGLMAGRKKKTPASDLADKLGLDFTAERNYRLANEIPALAEYRGTNRYNCNRFSGTFQQKEILAFDFHYETDHGDQFKSFIVSVPDYDVLHTGTDSILHEDLKLLLTNCT